MSDSTPALGNHMAVEAISERRSATTAAQGTLVIMRVVDCRGTDMKVSATWKKEESEAKEERLKD